MVTGEGNRNSLVVVMLEGEKVIVMWLNNKFWIISNVKNNYLLFGWLQSHAIHPKEVKLNPLKTVIELTHLCITYMEISLVFCSGPAIHRCSRRSYSEKSHKFYKRTLMLESLFLIKLQAYRQQDTLQQVFSCNLFKISEQFFQRIRPRDYLGWSIWQDFQESFFMR